MTANVMSGDAEKAYESGMQDYVSKPINIPHLERVLVNYLLHAGKVSDSINSMPTRHISVVEQVSSESFDSSLGLLNANSDDVLYRKILTKSIDSIPINIHDLDVAFQACDWKSAERFAHTIKGLAATIGAQKLSNSASYIEQTLSQLDSESDYYDNDSYNALSQQWTEAQAEIQAFLLDYVSNEKDPNAQKIDSKSTLSQDLTKLIEVLEEYDFDSKVLIEQIVSNHKNKSISPKLVELDQFIEAYDFDRALELAQSILDNGAH
jgi:HPt (histidine-containing phosphotransfer) domain-containing protein